MTWWAQYIGLPFERAHCWGLVRLVYADRLGVMLPEYGEISAADLVRVARAIDSGQEAWARVMQPQALDVTLMRGRSRVWHVGVMTDPGHVLHTEQATGAVRVRVDDPTIAGRITGFRRYAA